MKTLKEILMSVDPVSEFRAMVADGSLAVLEPAIADLEMDIPKGFHHKNNLDHSLRVLQNAIDREVDGADLVLRTAALFHDIGKPATRKFGVRKSVTFDGHEHVGAKITRKVLSAHGFSKAEIKEIALLVALHMRSHGFGEVDWTDSAVRRLIADAGNAETLARLVIVFYADATTMNMKKLRGLHASVDRLALEIERVMNHDARKALRPALDGHEVMEIFELKPGRELGQIMKFLNSDEGVSLSKEESLAVIHEKFIH